MGGEELCGGDGTGSQSAISIAKTTSEQITTSQRNSAAAGSAICRPDIGGSAFCDWSGCGAAEASAPTGREVRTASRQSYRPMATTSSTLFSRAEVRMALRHSSTLSVSTTLAGRLVIATARPGSPSPAPHSCTTCPAHSSCVGSQQHKHSTPYHHAVLGNARGGAVSTAEQSTGGVAPGAQPPTRRGSEWRPRLSLRSRPRSSSAAPPQARVPGRAVSHSM